jgi:hypothetical protein
MKKDVINKNHTRIQKLFGYEHISEKEISETLEHILDIVYEYGYIDGAKDALDKWNEK